MEFRIELEGHDMLMVILKSVENTTQRELFFVAVVSYQNQLEMHWAVNHRWGDSMMTQ